MYIQITTRCNMECPHCCFSCTNKGEDMSLETFREALAMGDEYLTLGGGEPTMHPLFDQFLLEAIGACDCLLVITNGKNENRARMLMNLARKEVLSAELSIDDYHEPLDSNLEYDWIQALGKRAIRNTTKNQDPVGVGRAVVELGIEPQDKCMCEDLIVKPNGDLHICGCPDSPCVGDVWTGVQMDIDYSECWKDQPIEIMEALGV